MKTRESTDSISTKWRKPKKSWRPRSAQRTGEGGGQEKAIECTEQAPSKTERGTSENTAPAFPWTNKPTANFSYQKESGPVPKTLSPKKISIRHSLERFHHCFAFGLALNKERKREDCNHTSALEKHSALPRHHGWYLARVDTCWCENLPCRCLVSKRRLVSDTLHVGPWARARALSRRIFSPFLGWALCKGLATMSTWEIKKNKVALRRASFLPWVWHCRSNSLLSFQQLAFSLPTRFDFSCWCLQERRCSSMQGICANIQG